MCTEGGKYIKSFSRRMTCTYYKCTLKSEVEKKSIPSNIVQIQWRKTIMMQDFYLQKQLKPGTQHAASSFTSVGKKKNLTTE